MPTLLRIPQYCTTKLSLQHKIRIYSMFSDFNVVHTVLHQMDADIVTRDSEMITALASYLEWILIESGVRLRLNYRLDPG